jgi:hypothetical protein
LLSIESKQTSSLIDYAQFLDADCHL